MGEGAHFLGGKDREQELIQIKFEVCRLAIIRFYRLAPADVESQDKGLRRCIKNGGTSPKQQLCDNKKTHAFI